MDDLISRAAALDVINTWGRQKNEKIRMGLLHRDLDAIPTVDAVPVVHARWQGVSPFVDTEECSNCRYNIQSEELETPYCPWCGAKMDGERRDNE
jgi:ssDNA-binding Zn-finger/Zn-ribbon topoisomerase 1